MPQILAKSWPFPVKTGVRPSHGTESWWNPSHAGKAFYFLRKYLNYKNYMMLWH